MILELCEIEPEKNLEYEDLNPKQKGKVMKYIEKLESASSCWLTFLDNQNLIHVEREERSYFFHTDHASNDLINLELGVTNNGKLVNFVLYRKKQGFLRSPLLIGYLQSDYINKDQRKPEVLFMFPEVLAKRDFYLNSLKKKYNLEEDIAAGYRENNDMGDEEHTHVVTYKQTLAGGGEYDFWVHK